jgi:hypothetical protein
MKTLIFSNQGLSPLHFGIELEIAQKEVDAGNDLHILYCKSNLQTCFFNPNHNLLACAICESRTTTFYSKLQIPSSNITPLNNIISKFQLPEIAHSNDIFNISYKGYDIGRGIASSYISSRRNYEYKKKDKPYLEEMAIMTSNVVENIEQQLKEFAPDKVILFNGRFSELNAVIEVCKKYNVDFYTFESSTAKNKYLYFKNVLPHSISFRSQDMEREWKEAVPETRIDIAELWFNNRYSKDSADTKKFLAKQVSGHLPNKFDPKKENIALFIGSEDEHKTIKEHQFHQYEYQNNAIDKILHHFSDATNMHFYLRVHPNLSFSDTAQIQEINQMNYHNLTIIPAQEKVDTYELMKSCNKIVSFGSTVGIEATYHGKPSISFAHSYYGDLGCCYFPQNYEDLFDLITENQLLPKKKSTTYKYGYYQSVAGLSLKKFSYNGITKSTFDSQPIKRVNVKTIWTLLRNLGQLHQWKKMNKIIFNEKLGPKNALKLNSHVMNQKSK